MLLGAGIDFPFWQTFNLQRVFPGLQDKLAAFPVASLYNRMIRDWVALRPKLQLFSKPQLMQQLEQMYGAYALALAKGAKPYQVSDRNPPFKTAAFIVEQTKIDRQTVVAFLSSLEKLAKEGGIAFEYWDPKKAVTLNKAVSAQNKAVSETRPKGAIEETANKITKTLAWIAGGVVVLGGVYLVSQAKTILPKSRS